LIGCSPRIGWVDRSGVPNDLSVDSAGHTVLELQVHLGDGVLGEDGGIGDITDGSRLNHVADGEPLDSLVLGNAAGAVGAAHRLDVAAAILVATAKEIN